MLTVDVPSAPPMYAWFFVLTVAPLLMFNVPIPFFPTYRESVVVQDEFVSCMLTVPIEPEFCAIYAFLVLTVAPLLILSVPVPFWPTYSVSVVVQDELVSCIVTVPLEPKF